MEKKKNIKIDQRFKNKFKGREIWCAASTHQNEELLVAKVHKKIKILNKKLLTIIIPRHINRSKHIKKDLEKLGLKTILFSSGKKIDTDTDIYIVDTYGEASNFYALCKVAFLGGSIIPHGGQNPLEPARLGNYILHGPNIFNFKEVYSMLKKLKISSQIKNQSDMERIIIKNIKYKQPTQVNKKLYSIGQKILNQNLSEIKKLI